MPDRRRQPLQCDLSFLFRPPQFFYYIHLLILNEQKRQKLQTEAQFGFDSLCMGIPQGFQREFDGQTDADEPHLVSIQGQYHYLANSMFV